LKEGIVQTRGDTKTYSKEKSSLQKINELWDMEGIITSSYDPTKP
jgi:hypothetical protein